MASGRRDQAERDADWARSERRSFWVALVISLAPIPAALLISWALGSPPWRPRPDDDHGPARDARSDPDDPWPVPTGHAPRQ